MPSGRSAAPPWASPIAPCSAISGTRSATITGTCWCATAAGSRPAARSSATSGQDYSAALQRHYQQGPPADWQAHFVSAYATTHPWEDFAETWAHYLHIVDTLETADAFGLQVSPKVAKGDELDASIDFDPYARSRSSQLVEAWLPLTFAVNSLNRCMGRRIRIRLCCRAGDR